MRHRELKARVQAAEQRVHAHLSGATTQARAIGTTAQQAVTPLRILVAGFISGAFSGWARPLRAAANTSRLMQMLRATPALYATLMPWLDLIHAVTPRPRRHGADDNSARPQ